MVRVELARIIIDEKNHDQAVVLKEKDGARQIPIMIGFVEATGIQMKIGGVEPPRPLTHDLLVELLKSLDVEVQYVLIDDLVDGTYFAKIHLKTSQNEIIILDCRPSDGIAIAIRLKTLIYVDEEVFQKALTSSDGA
ncbi:MAG: bifunctional nuclease family protein [Candidatus Omnitrophica bacterium]|nr:bifunctional nuclease family protein [Candidatus Omnitrophota bacterium]